MARINRTNVIQKAVNDLALSQTGEKIPSETLEKVQLTYSLNSQFSSFITSSLATTTGSVSINLPSVSTGSETYITSVTCSFAKDATCDVATGALNATLIPADSGITSNVLRQAVLTLTADSQTSVIEFPYPLKVKNASPLAYTGTFSAGAMSRTISATGFVTSSN